MLKRFLRHAPSPLTALALLFNAAAPFAAAPASRPESSAALAATPAEARAALAEARRLLKRYEAGQAFNRLQAALGLFKQAGDQAGVAAVNDALGDVYAQSAQYDLAFKHYREAHEIFRRLGDTQNANAVTAKIGERYLLLGDIEKARAAFAAMTLTGPQQALNSGGGSAAVVPAGGTNSQKGGRQAAVGAGAAAAGLASCLLPAFGNSAINQDPKNPSNQGRAPRTPNGVGRMDLRVADEAGNPVKGVRAQIQSTRPGGLYCECWETSNNLGRALMPPLHIADKIKLVLRAPGLPKQELIVSAQELAQPVRVVVSQTGAKLAASSAASVAQAAGPCFGLYRALFAYASGELGTARADFFGGRLRESRARYEELLAQLGLPALASWKGAARFRAAALTALGDIALRENRFADAAKLYGQAIDAARKDNRLDLVWAAQRGLGQAAWQQYLAAPGGPDAGRLRGEAMTAYLSAVKTIDALRAGSLRADEARATFLATMKDVFDEAAGVLTELALVAAGPSAPTDAATKAVTLTGSSLDLAANAFAVVEQGRARALLDLLGESRAGIREGIPPDLLKRREEIVARQQEITQALIGVTLPADAPPAALAELEKELEKLTAEYDAVENSIRTGSARYASLSGAQPLKLAEVQQRVLDPQTVLLLYSLGQQQSYLWVVSQNAVAVVRLPARPSVDSLVSDLRAHLIPAKARRSLIGVDVPDDLARGLVHEEAVTPPQAPAASAVKPQPAAPVARRQPQPRRAGAPARQQQQPTTTQPQPQTARKASAEAAAYAASAHALYKTILAPAAGAFAGKRLLVVADGSLNFVPFEALVTEPATGAPDFTALAYLVKSNEVAYAPSASVVAALRRHAAEARRAQAGGSVLVVADPVFNSADVRAKANGAAPDGTAANGDRNITRGLTLEPALADSAGVSAAATDKLKIARLVNTRSEANEIAQLARSSQTGADVWLDLEASEGNLAARDVRRYRVLHFATHGLLNTRHPQMTGLVLSLVGENKGDGFLRVNEVFNFRLGAPLVMLSACETGLGKEKRGEGVMGLTRAFMYAGAPTVGVSLWAVADRSTAQLMGDFYRGYFTNKGAQPNGALRQAQLKMIANPRYSAPYYWAPFVLIGDWL